jgi:hypothetical protein
VPEQPVDHVVQKLPLAALAVVLATPAEQALLPVKYPANTGNPAFVYVVHPLPHMKTAG